MQFVKEFVPDVLSSNFPQPYLITPKAGSRALTYASEDYHVACHYSTRGSEYGFIKEFESTIGAIVGYMDFGIENQDSPVMAISEEEAERYDAALEPMEKKHLPSQEEFYIMSRSFVEG